MSSLDQIIGSVDSLYNDAGTTPEMIVNMILSEKWSHENLDNLTVNDLSYQESQWLTYWAMTNSHHYKRVVPMATDMREIFPGLLFGTALEFCVIHF